MAFHAKVVPLTLCSLFSRTYASGNVCAGLTASVTIGFVYGLVKGRVFSKLDSVPGKVRFIKKNYVLAFLSTLGLALCGVREVGQFIGSPRVLAGLATLFSGLVASTVAFQFYQLPNLVSSTEWPDHSAVSLSLLDALAFFATAQILNINTIILGHHGWTASWTFMAMIFGIGGALMMKAIPSVLTKVQSTSTRLKAE